MLRARPTSSTYLARLRHQLSDFWTVFTFSAPTLNLSTRLRVGTTTLHIRQWSGSDVGSGGAVWSASRRLCQYLEEHGDGSPAVPSTAEGKADAMAVSSRPIGTLRLIELGSGTGAAGLAAAVLGFGSVTLSDQASFRFPNAPGAREAPARSLLDLARTNLQHNMDAIRSANTRPPADSATAGCSLADTDPTGNDPVSSAPAVARLLWGDDADHAALPHAKYDVVMGSDVLLFTSAMLPLLATLRRVSHEGTVVLIEHTDRALWEGDYVYPLDLAGFLAAVEAEGRWESTIVRDVGRHITLRMVRRSSRSTQVLTDSAEAVDVEKYTK